MEDFIQVTENLYSYFPWKLEQSQILLQLETIIVEYLAPSLHFWHPVRLGSGEGSDTPLQYSCLENTMDGGAWWAAVHGVAKSRTRLRDFTFTFHFHALEKEMATHSSILAWRILGTEEPGAIYGVSQSWTRLKWLSSSSSSSIGFIFGLDHCSKQYTILLAYWELLLSSQISRMVHIIHGLCIQNALIQLEPLVCVIIKEERN